MLEEAPFLFITKRTKTNLPAGLAGIGITTVPFVVIFNVLFALA